MRSFVKTLSRFALTALMIGVSITFLTATTVNEYKFKVHNKSDSKIVKLLASADGKKYGVFDIGAGIKAGETVELVWDKTTDDSNCEWYLKAVFADKSESDPAEFDFCEKNLVVEFSE